MAVRRSLDMGRPSTSTNFGKERRRTRTCRKTACSTPLELQARWGRQRWTRASPQRPSPQWCSVSCARRPPPSTSAHAASSRHARSRVSSGTSRSGSAPADILQSQYPSALSVHMAVWSLPLRVSSGVRNKAEYRSLTAFTDNDLRSDFHFLTDVERVADTAHREAYKAKLMLRPQVYL
jgi:hypothetical protein